MAKQIGLIKVKGKLGDTVSYTLHGEVVTRTIGKLDKEKMKTAPQYETTRNNQSDFAKASKAGQLFRNALITITNGYTNYLYPIDVVKLMLMALKSDKYNLLGQRHINTGLKDNSVRSSFKKLKIFSKRTTKHYGQSFTIASNDEVGWTLQPSSTYNAIEEKYPIFIKIGYLYIDFETMHSQFVADQLVLPDASKIEPTASYIFPIPNDENTSWVFIIQEVWQTYPNGIPDLLYMGVADVWQTGIDMDHSVDGIVHNCTALAVLFVG